MGKKEKKVDFERKLKEEWMEKYNTLWIDPSRNA